MKVSARKRIFRWFKPLRVVVKLVPVHQRILVILGLFLSSLFELIGLTMIVPLLALSADISTGKKGLVTAIQGGFEAIGLPFHPSILLGFIVVGLTLKAAVVISVMRYVGQLVAGITQKYQLELTQALMRAEWRFFIAQPLGRLTQAAGQEAGAVGECFQCVASIFASVLQTVLFVGIAFLVSWPLATLILFTGFLMFFSFGKLVRMRRQAAKNHRLQLRNIAAHFTDTLIGIKPLRSMARTERISQLFEKDAIALNASSQQRVLSDEYVSELQEPIIGCMIALGFFFAAKYFTIAPHELLVISLLFARIIAFLVPMQRMIARFLQSYDLFQSLQELLRQTKAAAEVNSGSVEPQLQRQIELESVTFNYGLSPVLVDVSLTIPSGKITTLYGVSGVGKSTIADLILALYRPQSGRILIDDIDLCDIDITKWRQLIGYVPQELTLFHTSIYSNLCLWDEALTRERAIQALEAAGAWSFVQNLPEGLDYVVGERGNRLSGGQRQRIAIARALIHNPQLLILDEATTGLDQQTEQEICKTILELCRDRNMTVLSISHQPAWRELADIVYWVDNGGRISITLLGEASALSRLTQCA